jgi:hypothetical protein
MIPHSTYVDNLYVAQSAKAVQGCVVECGVWRGGMIAGIADLLGPDRSYFLFDSFEGLPPAEQIDGASAIAWQNDKSSPEYHDNCKAEIDFAKAAMARSGARDCHFVKGWFDETLPGFVPPAPIAVLRLDADWYRSTMVCLESLMKYLAPDGLVIIDDYYTWDGCSRAVHDYLSINKSELRITQPRGVCVLRPIIRPQ